MGKETEVISIDGSEGEGGGQILRSALTLSLITGVPVEISKIRAGRKRPGLLRQHLACARAAQMVSGALMEGDELQSTRLLFSPGKVKAGEYHIDIGSAGSTMLVLQTLFLPLALADSASQLEITGGTHNPAAPPFHFVAATWLPLLKRLGVSADLSLRRIGFYPAGGGCVRASFTGGSVLAPFDLMTRGELRDRSALCLAPGLRRSIAQRELEVLQERLGLSADQLAAGPVRQAEGPGNALMCTLLYESVSVVFTAFGERGRPAEAVSADVAEQVLQYQQADGAADPHLADQWLMPLALAVQATGRTAAFRATQIDAHGHSNLRVIEQFLPVQGSVVVEGDGVIIQIAAR